MTPTPQQAAAIGWGDGDALVAASAGSGKTEVMARRVVALLTDPNAPCDVDQLLVVTFTRAAAAELRLRIAGMLRRAADSAAGPAARRLRRQEILLDCAEIGTIDAWCGRLLREFHAHTEVDPAFGMLAPIDAALLRQRVLDELLRELYRGDEELSRDVRAWLGAQSFPGDAFLRELVLGLNRQREHLVEPRAWFEAQRSRYSLPTAELRRLARREIGEGLLEELEGQLREMPALHGGVGAGTPAALRDYAFRARDWSDRLRRILEGEGASDAPGVDPILGLLEEIHDYRWPTRPRGLPARESAAWETLKERWHRGRLLKGWPLDAAGAAVNQAPRAALRARTLLALEERFDQRLRQARSTRRVLEFSDVLRAALDLLGQAPEEGEARIARRPSPVAALLRDRYRYVLVDECQDTSPLQVELLRLVARIDPGNRFLVGDLKQSIYGFREAEPRLFAALFDEYRQRPQRGRVLPLTDNFRSHASLLAGLNAVFGQLFDPGLGGVAYDQTHDLTARRAELSNPTLDGDARISVHTVESPAADAPPPEDGPELQRAERESLIASGMIRGWLEQGVQIPERRPDGSVALRPLRSSDCVVLLRAAHVKAVQVAGIMRAAGLPAVAGGRESLLDSREVQDVRAILVLLCNRRRDLELAAWLRGPAVGLSARALLLIRRRQPQGRLWRAVCEVMRRRPAAPLARRLSAAVAQLDRWRAAAREMDVGSLVERVIGETDLRCFAAGLPNGATRLALLDALQQFAREFASRRAGGVAELVAHLDALADGDMAPQITPPQMQDAVRVMTIHASKGLEFPVVFLLDAGSRFNRRDQAAALLADEKNGLALRGFDHPLRTKLVTPPWFRLRRGSEQRMLDEELRLLYVAMTRARERLVVVGHHKPPKDDESPDLAGQPLTLRARQDAGNMLDWVLMAARAGRLDEPNARRPALVRIENHPADSALERPARRVVERSKRPATALAPEDERWVGRAASWVCAEPDLQLARTPAVLAVSLLKEAARSALEGERVQGLEGPVSLAPPRFAAAAVHDGRPKGVLVHRVLQHADLSSLASAAALNRELERLISAGLISAAESAELPRDDLLWFGSTPIAARLTSSGMDLRREVPFVCARKFAGLEEPVIVRGVIDALVVRTEGLEICDYKTDRIRSEEDLERRLAGYRVQLQLYAAAAEAAFDRPVQRASLVFLSARRVEEAPLDGAAAQRAWQELCLRC